MGQGIWNKVLERRDKEESELSISNGLLCGPCWGFYDLLCGRGILIYKNLFGEEKGMRWKIRKTVSEALPKLFQCKLANQSAVFVVMF